MAEFPINGVVKLKCETELAALFSVARRYVQGRKALRKVYSQLTRSPTFSAAVALNASLDDRLTVDQREETQWCVFRLRKSDSVVYLKIPTMMTITSANVPYGRR
jgi:hypothetical protein